MNKYVSDMKHVSSFLGPPHPSEICEEGHHNMERSGVQNQDPSSQRTPSQQADRRKPQTCSLVLTPKSIPTAGNSPLQPRQQTQS